MRLTLPQNERNLSPTRGGDGGARSADAGFTLTELMIVIAIVGILLTAGIRTAWHLLPDSKLSAEARNIAITLEDARDMAILIGRPVHVDFDLVDGIDGGLQSYRSIRSVEIGKDDEEDPEDTEADRTLIDWSDLDEGTRMVSIVFPDQREIRDGYHQLTFQADGTTEAVIIKLYSPEIDGWASIRVSSLVRESKVYLADIDQTEMVLTEDSF